MRSSSVVLRMFRPVETCMVPTLGAALAARPRGWLALRGEARPKQLETCENQKIAFLTILQKKSAQHTRDLQELPQR